MGYRRGLLKVVKKFVAGAARETAETAKTKRQALSSIMTGAESGVDDIIKLAVSKKDIEKGVADPDVLTGVRKKVDSIISTRAGKTAGNISIQMKRAVDKGEFDNPTLQSKFRAALKMSEDDFRTHIVNASKDELQENIYKFAKNSAEKTMRQNHLYDNLVQLEQNGGIKHATKFLKQTMKQHKIDTADLSNKIKAGSLTDDIEKLSLKKLKSVHKRIVGENIRIKDKLLSTEMQYKPSQIAQKAVGVDSKLSEIYALADALGATHTREQVRSMWKLNNEQIQIRAKLSNINRNAQHMLNGMSDDAQTRVRQYVEQQDMRKVQRAAHWQDDAGGVADMAFYHDTELAKQLKMSRDEVIAANKLTNVFSSTREMEMRISVGDNKYLLNKQYGKGGKTSVLNTLAPDDGFGSASLPNTMDDMPGNDLLRRLQGKDGQNQQLLFMQDGVGDVGVNYWPRTYTEEALKDINKRIVAKGGSPDNINTRSMYQRSRSMLDAGLNYDKRLDPMEEVEHHFHSYAFNAVHKQMTKRVHRIKQTLALYDTMGQDVPLREVRMFKGHLDELEKTVADVSRIAGQPETLIGKIGMGAIDIATGAVLGPANPNLLFANSLQWLTNSVAFRRQGAGKWGKTYLATMKASGAGSAELTKAIGDIKKEGMKRGWISDKGIARAMKSIKSNKSLSDAQKDVVEHYMQRYQANPAMLDLHTTEGLLGRIMDWNMGYFRLSDFASRIAGLLGAADDAGRAWERFKGKIHNSSAPTAAVHDDLVKALNMQELSSLERSHVMEAVKSKDEFVKRFSSLVTNKEFFDYSAFNRPHVLNILKKHPLTARASRFTSWSLYWGEYMKGMVRAWQGGNKRPAAMAGALAATWWGATSTASGFDVPVLQDVSRYLINRTPYVSPVMSISQIPFRPLAGPASSVLGTAAYPAVAAVDAGTDLLQSAGGNGKFDSFDWAEKTTRNAARGNALGELLTESISLLK